MKKRQVLFMIFLVLVILPLMFITNIELFLNYLRIIFFIILAIVLYMYMADIESVPPKEIILNYNLKQLRFKDRNVYVLSSIKENKNNKYILYFHGGSYVMETSYKHWQFLGDLVNSTNATLVLPDYPLTPKHTYKDVFEMIEPIYEEMIKKVGKENLILMGDSAGGGMALGLIQKMNLEKKSLPLKTILLSPWLDVKMENRKIVEVEKKDPSLIKEALIIAGKSYAGKDGMESFLVNPINGPMDGIKNVYIYTGTYDILNPDVHVFLEKNKDKNCKIKLVEIEKAIHIWMTYRNEKEVYHAKETFNEIVDLICGDL